MRAKAVTNKPKPSWRVGPRSAATLESDDAGHLSKLSTFCFPDIPVHFPLKKKLMLAKTTTFTGVSWENLQLVLSVIVCVLLIFDAYFYSDYGAMRVIYGLEVAITQVFVIDFAFQTYVRTNSWGIFFEVSTYFDIITILPIFVALIYPQDMTDGQFFVLYCCRLLRSVRLFKVLRKLSGKNKYIATFAILLSCSSFFVTGCYYHLENMEFRHRNGCSHISEATSWEASCESESLVTETNDGCDCSSCFPYYRMHDEQGAPGRVRCNVITFFDAIYFTMITGTAIGYGDFSPLYVTSRLVVLLFIVATLIAVPIQINTLSTFMTSLSPYRAPYTESQEYHVVICGHVNDKPKLEKFFKEFFHPDRLLTSTEEYHCVILGTGEPTEEVRNFLVSPVLDTRVTYVIGSALSVEDLKRAKADTAVGIFFLCNTDVLSAPSEIEDTATIMRSLSVANYRPELRSLVQILNPDDKAILKDSDVDVILCLGEFKTALIARNAICPGFSTFIENIFHSFGNVSTELENSMDPWYSEYLHGARKELYYCPLSTDFLSAMDYSFCNIAQAIYLEFDIITIGVCDMENHDIILNPTSKDILSKQSIGDIGKLSKAFFLSHNVAVILADDQLESDNLARALKNADRIEEIVSRMDAAEESFKTRHYNPFRRNQNSFAAKNKFKFLARSIVQPIKRTALSAQKSAKQKVSKYAKVEGEDHNSQGIKFLRPQPMDTNKGLSDSSDDEAEDGYIGYKFKRFTSELPLVFDTSKSTLSTSSAEKEKRNKVPVETEPLTTNNMATASENELPAYSISRHNESRGVPTGMASQSMKLGNQFENQLSRTPSNDQVQTALKRRSEPMRDQTASGKHSASAKRNSEPPSCTSNKLLIETIKGPPLNMTLPDSPIVSGGQISFSEESETVMVNKDSPRESNRSYKGSTKLKPLSRKESSDKLSARQSAKLRKLKHNVRKNVVVMKSSKVDCRTGSSSKARTGNSVKNFESFDSMDPTMPGDSDLVPESRREPLFTPAVDASVALCSPSGRQDKVQMQVESFEYAPQSRNDQQKCSNSSEKLDAGSRKTPSLKAVALRPLSARNKSLGNIVGTVLAIKKKVKKWTDNFGKQSCEIDSADSLKNHIILFGPNPTDLLLFISELRRPTIRRLDYHPIVILGGEFPSNLDQIFHRFNDIYFIRGYPTKTSTFKKMNIESAFSMVLFSFVSEVTVNSIDVSRSPDSPDADALFMYLKLQQHIPSHVFFFVELQSVSNVSVLNSTLTRRLRELAGHAPSLPSELASGITKRGVGLQSSALLPPLLASLSSKYFSTNDVSKSARCGDVRPAASSRSDKFIENKDTERIFWDAMDSHHILPVFAAGRVYVPETFETLMVQSFYNSVTPIICDKLVCGQKGQAVMQAKLPATTDGMSFVQLYRLWSRFEIVVFGLFRAPCRESKSFLPFVHVCPPARAKIRKGDAVLVYARNAQLLKALAATAELSS